EAALAAAERLLARLDQPLPLTRAPAETVDDELHLAARPSELRQRLERRDPAAQPDPRVAGLEQVAGLLLPPETGGGRARREHQHRLPFGPPLRIAADPLGAVHRDRTAAVPAMDGAEPGEQQAQVVVDLGRRRDRRAEAPRRRDLLDRDGRGEAVDRVD